MTPFGLWCSHSKIGRERLFWEVAVSFQPVLVAMWKVLLLASLRPGTVEQPVRCRRWRSRIRGRHAKSGGRPI